ncbi:MAG: sugar phosphate isomerase/epimerase [candidate division KSB1 bacterium]|nr:sugar phosphate isomerase/epimerase [candidate division KSB1 bacterium]
MTSKIPRREFFQLAGIAATSMAVTVGACAKKEQPTKKDGYKRLNLGLASYTFREFSTDEALSMTNRLGLKWICFKSMHLPLESTPEEIQGVVAKVKKAGLELYGCGVVYMNNKAEVHQAFEYAKAAGMKVIIGVPEHHLLELVNQKVQEFDIKLAIHNHGPGDERYPTPQSAYEKIKHLDPRLGLCIDIGHTIRAGVDPSEAVELFADRLFDVHVKDESAASNEGQPVEIGRGVIDIPKFLRTLLKINYTGIVALEYEKDAKDPLPGAAESIGYLKGVLAVS